MMKLLASHASPAIAPTAPVIASPVPTRALKTLSPLRSHNSAPSLSTLPSLPRSRRSRIRFSVTGPTRTDHPPTRGIPARRVIANTRATLVSGRSELHTGGARAREARGTVWGVSRLPSRQEVTQLMRVGGTPAGVIHSLPQWSSGCPVWGRGPSFHAAPHASWVGHPDRQGRGGLGVPRPGLDSLHAVGCG
jgi:hypothetical protein